MGVEITLNDALGFLNPEDDSNWTHDGLPRMDVIEKLMDDKSISRKDVTEADPEFCREVAVQRRAAKAIAEAEAALADGENQDDDSTEMQAQGRETQAQGQVNPEEALRDAIQEIAQEIENLTAERAEVNKAIDALTKRQKALQNKSQGQHSAKADTVARMEFIASQTAQRARRYEKGRKILQIIGKDGLNPQSRLDQAMRRKTQRGTRRPPPRTPNR